MRKLLLATFAATSLMALRTAPALADPFAVTYEAAGVQNTTASFSYVGVETFNEQTTGTGRNFTTSYGTNILSPYQLSGTYSGVQINPADQYGGAGGTGNYATTFTNAGYSLSLSATANLQAAPINYFGFWLSALDAGNDLSFYNNNTLVYSFSAAQVTALLGNQPAYLGNPNAAFKGSNSGQPYVFLNFYDAGGSFNKIVFSENPTQGGYESDNQTIGYYVNESGTSIPEPTAFAVLATGLAGLTVIRRRSA